MRLRLFLDVIFVVIYTKNMRLRLILDAKLVAIYTKKRKIATSLGVIFFTESCWFDGRTGCQQPILIVKRADG